MIVNKIKQIMLLISIFVTGLFSVSAESIDYQKIGFKGFNSDRGIKTIINKAKSLNVIAVASAEVYKNSENPIYVEDNFTQNIVPTEDNFKFEDYSKSISGVTKVLSDKLDDINDKFSDVILEVSAPLFSEDGAYEASENKEEYILGEDTTDWYKENINALNTKSTTTTLIGSTDN